MLIGMHDTINYPSYLIMGKIKLAFGYKKFKFDHANNSYILHGPTRFIPLVFAIIMGHVDR